MVRNIFVTLFIIVNLLSLSQAGVFMTSTQSSLIEKDKNTEQKMYLEKDRARMDIHSDKQDMSIIYRKDKETFWIINAAEKSYFEMTKADMDKMFNQANEAMQKMQEQLKNLPPEQREMMEKMMKGKMPGQAPQVEFKKTGTTKKINAWACEKFDGYAEKEKTSETWTTDFKKTGIKESDFDVFKDLSKAFAKMGKGQEALFSFSGDRHGLEGLPIKVISFNAGKATHQFETKEIKRQDFSASLFDLPTGLVKKSMGNFNMH